MCIVSKNEVDDSPAPRPARDEDFYIRRRPSHSHSARVSKVIEIRDGSHQSIRVPVRSGQVLRVSSTRGSRVEQRSSPIPTPAVERSSYIFASNGYDDSHLHPSRSPPVVLYAPTPPQAVSPRVSQTRVTTTYREHSSPRATQQSFYSRHSSHSRHSGHSRRHSRSGSSGGRRSHAEIVEPPVSETRIIRSRNDAGERRYSPNSPPLSRFGADGRVSLPSITHQRSPSRERSRERTSNGKSFLHPSPHEVETRRIQEGLNREESLRVSNGQVRGLLGNEDEGEAVRIVYGKGPRMSAGRLGTTGERNFVVEGGGRRHYGSQ